ncbi:CHAT domain-containing protein, partial [Lyngbya sp. CCY1209]|uniref:CHAT domain-containing protein n=1 Tax=Lyngbya sp. CCY1209 TaxID=2886103 RepID=UPI002D2158D7
RLEYTRTEAETILGLVPETESTAAFDFDANLEAILNSEELQNYQIIHFATHGLANGRNPALSGLVFSLIDEGGNWQNGYLRLNDIFNLNLP